MKTVLSSGRLTMYKMYEIQYFLMYILYNYDHTLSKMEWPLVYFSDTYYHLWQDISISTSPPCLVQVTQCIQRQKNSKKSNNFNDYVANVQPFYMFFSFWRQCTRNNWMLTKLKKKFSFLAVLKNKFHPKDSIFSKHLTCVISKSV